MERPSKGPRLTFHRAKHRTPMWTIRAEHPAYNVAHAMVPVTFCMLMASLPYRKRQQAL
jgi:hypothetical protein